MNLILTSNLIDIFAVCMLLASVLAMASERIRPLIRLFIVQSIFLAAFEFTVGYSQGDPRIYIMAIMTFGIKVLLIPKMLNYIISRINVDDKISLSVGIPGSILLAAALIIFSYFISEPLVTVLDTAERNSLVLSFSIMLIGMLMMATRQTAISEVVGLLMIENGLFLGAIALSNGMPFIVELGAFFDVLMAIIIIGIFAFRINKSFDTVDATLLRRLKE
ncbi:MAG TPA: hydrogenase [Candidatus Methanomethylophilaceae archaeon]|nr:hydrogenase [Candidatus Methanomethylophilaceae archaeon]